MRSLSLESILVNKNMKLLILLITLLVQTNSSLSKPTTPSLKMILNEILNDLYELEAELDQHKVKAFKHAVKVQLPHNIKNVCECTEAFARNLTAALVSVKDVLSVDATDRIQNILDNLNNPVLHEVKSSDSCTFKERPITHMDLLISKNTGFIQNWNSHCPQKKN